MDKGYEVIEVCNIGDNSKLKFIRIQPNDIKTTLREVFTSLSNLCWIESFDKEYAKLSFQKRAEQTLEYISNNIIKDSDDNITRDSGEYVVSELARKSVVEVYDYLDIPLAELIKKQKVGNPGFDFYSENKNQIILFGEAKYKTGYGAYQSALEQINRFEQIGTDIEDLPDIDRFCSDEALANVLKKKKGFIAAFSSKSTRTEVLLKHLQENEDFKSLSEYEELICIAINL